HRLTASTIAATALLRHRCHAALRICHTADACTGVVVVVAAAAASAAVGSATPPPPPPSVTSPPTRRR
ncbi:hypothetical protein Dimus_012556, partial [Dionaea muscipula]